MTGPLQGIRVLEVAGYITGPHCSQLLADLGAEVIKIEEPTRGDPFRGPDGYKPGFQAHNRSKRSLALNLKGPHGREVMEHLIVRTNVLVQNLRPGVAERLGFGYERARELKPDIVYCSISGFGQSGPYVHKPSYNDIGMALSGLLSQITDMEHPRAIGPGFSDHITGIFASWSILAALCHWLRTGEGQHVDVSMLEATIGLASSAFNHFFGTGDIENAYERPHTSQAYAFTCRDGLPLVIHLSSPPKFWQNLVRSLGRVELVDDPRFLTKGGRIERYDEIQAELQPIFATKPRAEWLRILDEADVPSAPLYRVSEVLQDPQVKHLGVEKVARHPEKGEVRMPGFVAHFEGTPLSNPLAPPTLGEHTDEIMAELGFDASQVDAFRRDGTLRVRGQPARAR